MEDGQFARMRDLLVKEGIESLEWEERDSIAREYATLGFEACLDAECLGDLALLLSVICKTGPPEVRYAKVQVRYVYEVLSQGFGEKPFGGDSALSRYREIEKLTIL